jgi:hypothetical protein
LNAAGSSILYFKLSDLGLDPLGEDPMTVERRESTLKIVSSKSDDELLESVVELSPRLQHIGRQYTRSDWTTVLRANVSGEKEFIISDDDWSFISALRGHRKVKDVLIEVEPRQDRRLCSIRGIRRLAKLGAIEFLP